MMSLIFYGMITYLLIYDNCSRRTRAFIVIAGVFVISMIGGGRLYLQVHFFSDVLAGYAGGLFWLTICITAVEGILGEKE